MPDFDYTQLPIIISLLAILGGLTFRGIWIWVSLTFAVLFLYVTDKDSIITLVIYALTASLMIFGFLNIRRGLTPTKEDVGDHPFTFVVDSNNLLGLVDWDLDRFASFINELEQDGLHTHLFFDYTIARTLRENNLMLPNETVPTAICRVLGRDRYNLTVSKKGYTADPLIIRYADRNNLTVLSNDKFDKLKEDKFILKAAERLKAKGLIQKVRLVDDHLTIM
ncbi:MAG: hypothetical protein EBT90_00235 [Rhodobacteraceae bacterium]|nr:hypothetical protein [Paracoccaceae bacterium]